MGLNLGKYNFDGPYDLVNDLQDRQGVFAVICMSDERNYRLIHVEQAGQVRSKVKNHIETYEWRRRCRGRIVFAADYTPELQKEERELIAREIKHVYS